MTEADGQQAGGGDGTGAGGREGVPNYYEVLGLDQKCTDAQIKKAYKRLALKLHPDKNRDNPNCERNFALLNEAHATLINEVKRIDYNKKLAQGSGQDAGWGWNADAARERARQYEWDGEGMFFGRGGNMHAQDEDTSCWDIVPAIWDTCRSQIIFWTPVSFTCLALQGLMIATSLSIGVTRMSTIWTPLLITTLYIGLLISPGLSVLEWPFPVGHYVATSSVFSLVGGLVSSDLFVQANSFYSSTGSAVDSASLPISQRGILKWLPGTRVDTTRARSDSSGEGFLTCTAPIVQQDAIGQDYDETILGFWAVSRGGCCPPEGVIGGGESCSGWSVEWSWGINWGMGGSRPSTLFLSRGEGSPSYRGAGGSRVGGAVLVEWSPDGNKTIKDAFETPAYLVLFGVSFLWPIVLALLWLILTCGFCCLPGHSKLNCNHAHGQWCFYACAGCASCWEFAPQWMTGYSGNVRDDDDCDDYIS